MESRERQELVDDLLLALGQAGAVEGSRLLELMRLEQTFVDGLAWVRREIRRVVSAASPP